MITCTVWTDFGLKHTGDDDNKPVYFKLATFNHDIELQVNEQLKIFNSKLDYIPAKEFEVIVKERRKLLILNDKQDSFEIRIAVEIADKEDLQEIRKTLQRLNPDKFKNLRIE